MAPFRRLLAIATQLALLLPFVTFEDCQTHVRETWTGAALLSTSAGPFFVLPALVAALLLWRPVGLDRPIGESLRAFGAAVAVYSTVGALLTRMFDSPTPRIGFGLATGSWALIWLTAVARSFRPPFGWGMGLVACTPGLVGVTVQLADGAGGDALAVAVTTLVLVVPLLPLFGALVGRARTIVWVALGVLAFASGIAAVSEGVGFAAVGMIPAIFAVWRALEPPPAG